MMRHDGAEFLRPRLRLFLSVDIVNSTALKQKNTWVQNGKGKQGVDNHHHKGAEDWFEPIGAFFYKLGGDFFFKWRHLSANAEEKLQWPKGNEPELWKAAGDELIYTVHLTDYRHAHISIQALIEAVREHRSSLRDRYHFLDLKISAWLAGFPVNNTEVVILSNPLDPLLKEVHTDPVLTNFTLLDHYYSSVGLGIPHFRDFIGPSMDTGFRVAGQSTARKMAISADLALMLAFIGSELVKKEDARTEVQVKPLRFHYAGRAQLKGVYDGTPYPIFWIDAASSDPLIVAEDALENPKRCTAESVMAFCELFLAQLGERHMPYILQSEEPYFWRRSNFHEQRLKSYADYWQAEVSKRSIENENEQGLEDTFDVEAETKLSAFQVTVVSPPGT